jgi:hypothetical protein
MSTSERATRRAALTRIALGFAQMAASAFAVGLLVAEGVSSRALIAAVVACTLTTISVMLFGARTRR